MVQRRTNILWGFIAVAIAGLLLARALGAVPENVFDFLLRAAPALLVLAGLSLLLRARVPFSGGIALLGCIGLVAIIATTAFNTRAGQQRDDTRQAILQPLSDDLILLRLRVETLGTEVEFIRALDDTTGVTGEFVGAADHDMQVTYEEADDNSATLQLREVQESPFPSLESIGRGTLRVELPANVPLDVEFTGNDGDVILNMSDLMLERLNVRVNRGNVVATLPDYDPFLSEEDAMLGTLATTRGDLAMFIPESVAARLELNREGSGVEPVYNAELYNYLVGDVLEARTIETAEQVVRYTLTVPQGRIRIEVPGAASASGGDASTSGG